VELTTFRLVLKCSRSSTVVIKTREMPTFSCAAILFDLDGVLVDSTRAVDREWREWAARKGVDGDAIMAIAHGVRTIEVIRRVAPYLDAEAEADAIENHEAGDQQGVTVMPGAVDLVKSIPDRRWGVVTSGSRLLATNRLALWLLSRGRAVLIRIVRLAGFSRGISEPQSGQWSARNRSHAYRERLCL
jgi:hypothetical protein